MSFMDFLRGKNKVSEEVKAINNRHTMMISHISEYEQGYNCYPEGWRHAEWSPSVDANGQVNGLTKTTKYADGITPTEYEFLVYQGLNANNQQVTNYYKVTPSGNFADTKGLATFTLEYNANYNGKQVPCEIPIRTNGASVEFLPVNPRELKFKTKVEKVDPAGCLPEGSDITHILSEFARVNGIALGATAENADDLYMGMGQR